MIITRVATGDGGVAQAAALSLADAKSHLSVLHSTDDTLITSLCEVARVHMEGVDGTGGIVGCAITQHMLEMKLPGFPAGSIFLPQPPLASVQWVKYFDASDTETTLATSTYHVVQEPMRPELRLAKAKSWPVTYERYDAVKVRFTVGPAAVPAPLLHALKLHVGHLYLNREIALEKGLVQMPMGYESLVGPYRRHGWV